MLAGRCESRILIRTKRRRGDVEDGLESLHEVRAQTLKAMMESKGQVKTQEHSVAVVDSTSGVGGSRVGESNKDREGGSTDHPGNLVELLAGSDGLEIYRTGLE